MLTSRSIEAVIFDMDGLMVDSEAHSISSWDAVLRKRHVRLTQDIVNGMFGVRLQDGAELIVRHYGLSDLPSELADEKTRYQIDHLSGNVTAMPGLTELLEFIGRRGLMRAMGTSGTRAYVQAVLAAIGLTGQFDVIVTGEDVVNGKPAPDVFLSAARLLDKPAAACLVLEDAPNGVQAAKAAGMVCFAIPNQHTRTLDLSAADMVLASLVDVIPLLGG